MKKIETTLLQFSFLFYFDLVIFSYKFRNQILNGKLKSYFIETQILTVLHTDKT